eukprot:TRINITY_DN799_c0_g1_i1.p1 TRINITY_DN799_c0_g1~~TRINITY_DN799_c0_g1_i1.p1  ORF type:complete len:488 (+),score=90.93 TRINITY_DN799_c0_g1_i1:71-1534(+)
MALRSYKVVMRSTPVELSTIFGISYFSNTVPFEYLPTILEAQYVNLMFSGVPVQLCVWDLRGSENYDQHRSLMFQGAQTEIVLLPITIGRSGFEQMRVLLMEGRHHIPDHRTPIFLCCVNTFASVQEGWRLGRARNEILCTQSACEYLARHEKAIVVGCCCVGAINCSAGVGEVFEFLAEQMLLRHNGLKPKQASFSKPPFNIRPQLDAGEDASQPTAAAHSPPAMHKRDDTATGLHSSVAAASAIETSAAVTSAAATSESAAADCVVIIPELSADPVSLILSRLDTQLLCKAALVSKSWNVVVDDIFSARLQSEFSVSADDSVKGRFRYLQYQLRNAEGRIFVSIKQNASLVSIRAQLCAIASRQKLLTLRDPKNKLSIAHVLAQYGRVDMLPIVAHLLPDATMLHEFWSAPADGSLATPVLDAVVARHVEMCKALIQLGANWSAPDHGGTTPLQAAEFLEYTEIAALLEVTKSNPPSKQGECALM